MSSRSIGVFVDRDGTLNEERDFVCRPEELELIAGAARAVRALNDRGLVTCVISNQSGVARGYLTETDLRAVHDRLIADLALEGARLDAIYYCPHHPTEGVEPYVVECDCRKPLPGMLYRGEREFGLDLNRSFVIGDKLIDIQAGNAVGAATVLVLTGYGKQSLEESRTAKVFPRHVVPSIKEAVDLILNNIERNAEKSN